MKDDETYLNNDIDESKIDYDPNLFYNKGDSEEDKESVRQTRLEYGASDEQMRKITEDINSNPSNKYSDDEDEKDDEDEDTVYSNKQIILSWKQKTETVETTVLDEEKSQDEIKKVSVCETIHNEANLERDKNNLKILDSHNSQSISNKLSIQREFTQGINKYHSGEDLKNYKSANEQQKYEELEKKSKLLIERINKDAICLYLLKDKDKDKYKDKYFYRKSSTYVWNNGSEQDVSNFFSESQKLVKIVNQNEIMSKDGVVTNNKLYTYILKYHIPIVEAEVFNPKEDELFIDNGLMYKNTFLYTKYLRRRLHANGRV